MVTQISVTLTPSRKNSMELRLHIPAATKCLPTMLIICTIPTESFISNTFSEAVLFVREKYRRRTESVRCPEEVRSRAKVTRSFLSLVQYLIKLVFFKASTRRQADDFDQRRYLHRIHSHLSTERNCEFATKQVF